MNSLLEETNENNDSSNKEKNIKYLKQFHDIMRKTESMKEGKK